MRGQLARPVREGGMKKRAGSNPANCASCRPHHDVAVVDDAGQVVLKERISDDAAGFTRLVELIVELRPDGYEDCRSL